MFALNGLNTPRWLKKFIVIDYYHFFSLFGIFMNIYRLLVVLQWHALDRSEQAKYYEMARKERALHMQLYPGWSARDNYAVLGKKKKRRKDKNQGWSLLFLHFISCPFEAYVIEIVWPHF